jgi:hypothetical protein
VPAGVSEIMSPRSSAHSSEADTWGTSVVDRPRHGPYPGCSRTVYPSIGVIVERIKLSTIR